MSDPQPGSSSGPRSTIRQAADGLHAKGMEVEAQSRELIELRHADSVLTNQLVKGARIALGQVELGENGEVITPSNSSTEQALVDPTTAQRNQAIAIGLELAIGTGWTTFFHQDIDPLVLAGGVGFIIAAGQAITTKINNRKA